MKVNQTYQTNQSNKMNFKNLNIISAGAGSGKTYRLTEEMVKLLKGGVRPGGIFATTFTKKAAAELQERVRVKLLESGMSKEADELSNAMIGTVHSLGVKLLRRFAFEAGVSPQVDIIADEDQQIMFNNSLATVLMPDRVKEMERLAEKFGMSKEGPTAVDWRKVVKDITDVARSNDFDKKELEKSRVNSIASFKKYLGPISKRSAKSLNESFKNLIDETIAELVAFEEDTTKRTETVVVLLKNFAYSLKLKGDLNWHEWVKISKAKVGAKSRDRFEGLQEFAEKVDQHPDFHADIENFISGVFKISMDAIEEYDRFKKQRGLIDYIDMELSVSKLLKQPSVKEVMAEELDLLMVDEFQDTSPIQLEIFLQLSRIAKYSVWVGDPKQSIYGFRGADPKLMKAIIEMTGGVKKENIQKYSWRSREDIVNSVNAIFENAFEDLPKDQIVLEPKRKIIADDESANQVNEPEDMGSAIMHWHYISDTGKATNKGWFQNCIADSVKKLVERKPLVFEKNGNDTRELVPGDIAILCRSNFDCQAVAKALHNIGLKAAISRSGLLNTAESKLILACLKFILQKSDSLSIAEIILLATPASIEEIIEDRLDFLNRKEQSWDDPKWGDDNAIIDHLNEIREDVVELSSAEILNLVLEEMDLRRIIMAWGRVDQRMANVDALRKLALQYEEACSRLHSAASLGGFLLWLNELEMQDKDMQGSGENKDTVNILTYHRSKGLEWPVVICNALEGALRERLFGINIVSESEEIDIENILDNRWIRYWINPYAKQIGSTKLQERMSTSEEKMETTRAALEEEARLLYVGLTRARDYLVFPSRSTPTKWLNRICNKGDESKNVLDANTGESNWNYNGKTILKETELLTHPLAFTVAEPAAEDIYIIEPREGKMGHVAYYADPLNEAHWRAGFKISHKVENFSNPIQFDAEENQSLAKKCVATFLAGDDLNYHNSDRLQMLEATMDRYKLKEHFDINSVMDYGTAFYNWIDTDLEGLEITRYYPIEVQLDDRKFEGTIDFFIKTKTGHAIIINKDVVAEKGISKEQVKSIGGLFYIYSKAINELFGPGRIRMFCHQLMRGELVEIEMALDGVPAQGMQGMLDL